MNNLNGKNLCNPHGFMRHRKTNGSIHPGIMVLKKNIAWMGCPNKRCKNEVAIKKCDEHEYQVQRALKKDFPKMIPTVYAGTRCVDGFYMYSEYIRNGTIKKHSKDPKLGAILHKVFLNLKRIHEKYPSFRHNDLHTDNVLVDTDGPLLYDFGYANWHGNPTFDSKLKSDYGIFPGNNPMYDFHFFANSVYSDLPQIFKNKVLSVFPSDYLGETSSVIKNGRLRCDVSHTRLPTMDQVINAFAPKKAGLLTFAGSPKRPIPTTKKNKMSPRVKFSLRNKERVRNRKAELLRNMITNNMAPEVKGIKNIQAEVKAIKNIERLKLAGLLPPGPSPVAPKPRVRRSPRVVPVVAVAGPSRPVPVVAFTTTPRARPKINKKLCSSYKKDELLNVLRRLGHRVNKHMTVKEMCSKLYKPVLKTSVYKRPVSSPFVNVRKVTYPKLLKKNLAGLAKGIGIKVLSKNKKGEIVNKLYARLNKNTSGALMKFNKTTVTARQLAEALAKNYGWKNNRHVERVRLLKIYNERK